MGCDERFDDGPWPQPSLYAALRADRDAALERVASLELALTAATAHNGEMADALDIKAEHVAFLEAALKGLLVIVDTDPFWSAPLWTKYARELLGESSPKPKGAE